ncbi:hypothetical protein MXB_1147, partial [Myxobolus squamalis]
MCSSTPNLTLCNGNGQCVCGACVCNKTNTGKYCEYSRVFFFFDFLYPIRQCSDFEGCVKSHYLSDKNETICIKNVEIVEKFNHVS